MIKIENLRVTYPDKTLALDHISFNVNDGEKVALIGANGAGKTSLIMSVVGVIPSQGKVEADGIVLSKNTEKEIRSKIGVVFQNPDDQLFMPTIYDDIAFGLINMGLDKNEINERIDRYLSITNIEKLKNRTSIKLSGGEKRMAALTAVLAMEPSVIMYDEPTAFLDPRARRNLINVLKEIKNTQIIATHDLTFALEVCPRTILIKEGKVFADGSTKEFLFDKKLMEDCGVEAIERYNF